MKCGLPDKWSDSLESLGYFVCNLGPMADVDLLRAASQVACLRPGYVIGCISNVKEESSPAYITLSSQAVPFHTDGMYLNEIPLYTFLYCESPGIGGATSLIDAQGIAARMDPGLREFLVSHALDMRLAGRLQRRTLVTQHPITNRAGFSYVDPSFTPDFTLELNGSGVEAALVDTLRGLVKTAEVVYKHTWSSHDILVLDNYRFLHGREGFSGDRWLKRILIATNAAGI